MIGYEPSADAFPSTVYSSMIGVPVPHTWRVDVDEITIRTELEGGAPYHGKWNQVRQVHRGGWRPDKGADPSNVAYDIWRETS